MIDLKALLNAVADLAGMAAQKDRPTTLESNGRTYIRQADGGYGEVGLLVVDGDMHLPSAILLDVGSVITWAKGCAGADGEVHLSRTGLSKAYSPRRIDAFHERDRANKPFYAAFLPLQTMTYRGFRDWLDSLGDGLVERDKIEEALASISTFRSDEVTVRMTGSVLQVKEKGGNVTSLALDRYIKAEIPFGDPGFSTEVTFMITADARNGLSFHAVVLPVTGAYDKWLAWAKERLEAELPEGWVVLATP